MFDDMDVCYGCMHRFAQEPGAQAVKQLSGEEERQVDSRSEPGAAEGEGVAGDVPRLPNPQVMEVPAVSVCAVAPGSIDQVRRPADPASASDQDALVLKIEIPRTCRGISVAYE
ncbi:MAG: hypothetical protein Q4D06_01295 [Coriobacteriia bacterium]|nr:hypothetical protein [Coriobacteriia bacterium]